MPKTSTIEKLKPKKSTAPCGSICKTKRSSCTRTCFLLKETGKCHDHENQSHVHLHGSKFSKLLKLHRSDLRAINRQF